MFDDSIRAAVAAFCSDYGVAEDPKVLQARTQDTVGPWLWEALVRAVHKKAAEAPPARRPHRRCPTPPPRSPSR